MSPSTESSSSTSKNLKKRLNALRLKMNQAHEQNLKEVVKEKAAIHSYGATPAKWKRKNRVEASNAESTTEGTESSSKDPYASLITSSSLDVTIAQCEKKKHNLKRKRKNVLQSENQSGPDKYVAMKKRAKNIPYTMHEYKRTIDAHEGDTDATTSQLLNDNDEQEYKDRMAHELVAHHDKTRSFYRRSEFYELENVDYINEKNKKYNESIERAYGKYAKDIKQALERGTKM